jgi:hypothetical protein
MIQNSILTEDELDILQLSFNVELYDEKGGLLQSYDLITNGKNIAVTNENKQ